jgi:CheY-like chemotaxis protein
MNNIHSISTDTTKNKKTTTSVMLVDNSSIDNFVNSKIITSYEIADNVLVFTKSKKALKYLIELNCSSANIIPFLIFLDLDMPEIDGFEFLNAFDLLPNKTKESIKIVILTNSFNPADAQRCAKHNSVIAFFHKPLIKNNLDALKTLLSEDNEILLKICN